MLIPVGEDVAIPVTVVILGPEPEIRAAMLTRLEVDSLRLLLSPPEPAVGVRVIVNASERTKLSGRVLSVDERGVEISRDRTHATDDRSAPRVPSRIELRWYLAPDDPAAAQAWLGGGPDPGTFAAFRGAGDLSMSGTRFRCDRAPPLGSLLLVELALGGQPRRALGVVRRIEPADPVGPRPPDLRDGPQDADPGEVVGVEFVDLPETTFDALSDFTLRNL